MASPMMSDSEAGIVDGFNGNEGMVMTMTMELILDRFSKLFSTRHHDSHKFFNAFQTCIVLNSRNLPHSICS